MSPSRKSDTPRYLPASHVTGRPRTPLPPEPPPEWSDLGAELASIGPHPVLVDLLAHASSAAHIVGHLDAGGVSATLEQLSDHVDAIVHGLSELLGKYQPTAELALDTDETNVGDELHQLPRGAL